MWWLSSQPGRASDAGRQEDTTLGLPLLVYVVPSPIISVCCPCSDSSAFVVQLVLKIAVCCISMTKVGLIELFLVHMTVQRA